MNRRRFPTLHQPTRTQTQAAISQVRDMGVRVVGWTKEHVDGQWAVVVHYAAGGNR